MRKIIVGLMGFVLLMSSIAPVMAGNDRLVLTGSTTVFPIAQKAAEVYGDNHPETNISVRGGGSGGGIAALIDGTCNIANASRPMKTKELLNARKKGINPVANKIAMDGIAVIVHPENSMGELSMTQIKDIYTGKISNWKEIGGKRGKIVVISRDSASGTFECFNKMVLKKEKVRPDALLQASNRTVAMTVAKTPGAIGYVGIGYLSPQVKALKVNGVSPSKRTVSNNTYPIARPLYMYTNGKPKGLAGRFISFIVSAEGQKLVEEEGFVAVK